METAMKRIIVRGIAIAAFGAAAAGLTAGAANARPLEETKCTPIDQVIDRAHDVVTSIFNHNDKKEEKKDNRCVN
jgi:hypothetical protein